MIERLNIFQNNLNGNQEKKREVEDESKESDEKHS